MCTGGLPGCGKSTLTRAIAASSGEAAKLIVSEKLREKFKLGNPFRLDFRQQLQRHLATEVNRHAGRNTKYIIVDSNLLEADARRIVCAAGRMDQKRVFIAPHADIDILIQRVRRKFGVGYMYPLNSFTAESVVSHSIYSGEPIFLEEALDVFDVIISVRTDYPVVLWWAHDESSDDLATALASCCLDAVQREGSSKLPAVMTRLKVASWFDRWSWDPESMGLAATLPRHSVSYHARRQLVNRNSPGDAATEEKVSLGDFATSYAGLLRSSLGDAQVILPSVRVVIRDTGGRILLIRRRDSSEWALVGGGHELDESVSDSARREVYEEAGIKLADLELFAVYSGSEHTSCDRFGNVNQGLVFAFLAQASEGSEPRRRTLETIDARWFELESRPKLSRRHEATLEDALSFEGHVLIK